MVFEQLECNRLSGALQKTIEDDNDVLYSSDPDQSIIRHIKPGEAETGTFEHGVFTAFI